jgi:hypothetical protein
MVDALLECWRVLEPGGTLIDLRPFHSNPAVEIITANEILQPGNINDEGGAADDEAADEALAETVRRGAFALEMQDSFQFANYWDTLQEMLDYAAEKWRDFSIIPAETIEKSWRFIADSDGPYQMRVRRKINMAVYRKRPT